jgi:DNA-binding CsgD family transcriptional regulator
MKSVQRTSVNCDRPNSEKCDHCVLNLLRPYLMQINESSPVFSQIQQVLTHFKHTLDQGGLIILAIDGQVRFITQQAEYLLNQYFFANISPELPEVLRHWFNHQISQFSCNGDEPSPCLSLNIEKGEQELVIHLIPDPIREQYLLLLKEKEAQPLSIASLDLLGLTKREAEVLFWIAKDKSNANIAKLLGCREGTVRKHLENIYKKLGVQTRIGAVMFALERLGLLKG